MAKTAQHLSRLRRQHGRAKDIARRAGVSWSTLYRLEAGDADPTLRTLCQLAFAMGEDLSTVVVAVLQDRPDLLEMVEEGRRRCRRRTDRRSARVLPYRRPRR